MAENLLQIAAGSFMKSKQPEKASQVRGILASVREEKILAASLNEVMQRHPLLLALCLSQPLRLPTRFQWVLSSFNMPTFRQI